ncbi:N-acetylmuramoyl-L-alanine amidase [Streptomyces sp. NPDC094149]|uniref:peptidoglycan recognition protein family protein n=1 Tax=Streptomyces sp. NPDC094149 TaxID=3155079 RepID=UPI0033256F8D
MAWYPGAKKMELQPESDAQPAIKPTQLILHSIVAPWTPERTYEYWRDSTNLESHFGLGYDGSLGQFIGTETRADANAAANRRADGTGAVSLESASNTKASDPWTAAQVEAIVKLGVWLHQKHGIPLRICRSASDPGFGYHRLFREWNPDAHACPGDVRVEQFHKVVFPAIVARATGATPTPASPTTNGETSMQLSDQITLGDWVAKQWPDDKGLADKKIAVNTALGSGYAHARRAAENTDAILQQLEALRTEVAQLRAAVTKGA